MKVDNYRIVWAYPTEIQTNCYILKEGEKKITGETIHAHSVCYKGDQFSYDTGRKKSLGTVLRSNPEFDREFRAKVWEAYRTMTKVPRWGKPRAGWRDRVESLKKVSEKA